MADKQKTRWRRQLLERDGALCHICGEPFVEGASAANPKADHPRGITIDHLIPRSAGAPRNRGPGGTYGRSNMMLAHAICNSARKDNPLLAAVLAQVRV